MGIGNPTIQLSVRKEAVSVTPLIGSLSSRPVELDFSQLLKAVKVRSNVRKKSISNAIPIPITNPVNQDKNKLVTKTNEQISILANPTKQWLVQSANRSTNQSFQDTSTPVKDVSARIPPQLIAMQQPTDITVTPLLQSDPLQLLTPAKNERSSDQKTAHTKTAPSDTKQITPPVSNERKENQSAFKDVTPTVSTAANTSPNINDPVKAKPSATTNRKVLEQSTAADAKSTETKKSETNQFVAPLDTKQVNTNQPPTNLEHTKHISAPTLPALIEKLGTEIKQRLRDGERTLELLVTAPLIGKIFIELSEKDGQWVAAFSADNTAMQDLLHRHRDQLSQSLTSTSGIPAEVIVANTNDNASFREQFAQSNGNAGSNATKQSSSTHEEASREYLPRTTIRPRSLTATREWIA